MYGYVRPDKGELKVSEFERYRGVYCGLCHELKRRYGPLCRFLVNYDFTFLAMLLEGEGPVKETLSRCPYHPFRKRACPTCGSGLAAAADRTVVLAWWKLRDGIADDGFFKALGCRIACLFLRRHYRRAAERIPDFARLTEENLRQLSRLEDADCPSIDETADKFARILQGTADGETEGTKRRILREILYHLGRIVYILDAVDDLAEDIRKGAYNPLRFRFSVTEDKLSPEDETALRESLQLSHNAISGGFVLLKDTIYTPILENILYFGLPAVTQSVFDGSWKQTKAKIQERSHL